MEKPETQPENPCFSSGPCAKHPNWSIDNLGDVLMGRSHRSGPGKEKLKDIIEYHRRLLNIPAEYRIAIMPASDTGAFEAALWSLLGTRGVDVLAWESFGLGWFKDIKDELKIEPLTAHTAEYGALPDFTKINFNNDVVFAWNGTTSGVRVPDGNWIPDDRSGLTICDATSAVFAYNLPWDKLDVTTWSWQKVLGGEAAHGMLVLSPRAVKMLENYAPPWPLPKIFRLTKNGKLIEGIFKGMTINTPSMLAVEDCLNSLKWVESIGGLPETIRRSQNNFKTLEKWIEKTSWVDFLAIEPVTRSTTSICLKIIDPWFDILPGENQTDFINDLAKLLEKENAALDIKSYRDAPSGLRIWGGATVETKDINTLTNWLDWGFETTKTRQQQKAA